MRVIWILLFILISIIINSGNIKNPEKKGYYVAYQDDNITIFHPMDFREKEIARPCNKKELRSYYNKIRFNLEKQVNHLINK